MSDYDNSNKIKLLVKELNIAVNEAAMTGLSVSIETHEIEMVSLGNAIPVPKWEIKVKIMRPL